MMQLDVSGTVLVDLMWKLKLNVGLHPSLKKSSQSVPWFRHESVTNKPIHFRIYDISFEKDLRQHGFVVE